MKTLPTTKIKRYGNKTSPGSWLVKITQPDGYVGGLRCDTRAEAREVARQIRSGELTQY